MSRLPPTTQDPDRVSDPPSGSTTRARRRLEGSILFALALSVWSRRAVSQGAEVASPLTLDWSAPAGCPSREHVVERVNAILGRSTKPRALTVYATAAQSPSGKWRVNLAAEREGGTGSREFEAESCEAAADAAALIVSLMIDPTAVTGAADVDKALEPEKTPPPAPAAKPPPPDPRPLEPAAPSAPPARSPLFAVRASLAGDIGTFSPANIGGELVLGVSPRRLRFELAGSYWAKTATLPGSSAEGARLELATLGARAAYVFPAGDVAFAPLAGVEWDWMSATGFGGTSDQSHTASWVAVALGATGSWFPIRRFHAVALSLTLEAVVATQQLRPFVATEPGGTDSTVAQPSQIAGRVFLGVEYRFF
jgi:hypothetical protein